MSGDTFDLDKGENFLLDSMVTSKLYFFSSITAGLEPMELSLVSLFLLVTVNFFLA